jgi:hypothetical protein
MANYGHDDRDSLTHEGRGNAETGTPMRRIITIFAGTIAILLVATAGLRALARARTFQLFAPLVAGVETTDSLVAHARTAGRSVH